MDTHPHTLLYFHSKSVLYPNMRWEVFQAPAQQEEAVSSKDQRWLGKFTYTVFPVCEDSLPFFCVKVEFSSKGSVSAR